ncbi:MAG: hypothetical protein ACYC9L_10825 [Sulfuricaulis sp.]
MLEHAAHSLETAGVRVLFDQGIPAPLRKHLSAHQVSTAHELGWLPYAIMAANDST